ncbi:TonB-dependent receptor [Flagellimonas sp. HMM57]|uniref:TonB-dependent receptor n=1 Tax=unclassified Flagellimonas TaxID=2644544 RepID=UPI0013D3225B|nr:MULTISPECIES: TonB-dependent receptor [unclassified Flagellimonas]UII74519.1 TonB-dependent receptor [Flagellimonas sp. HMM57]
MRKIVLVLFAFVGLAGMAQTGVIKGIVIDKQSEQPLQGATVELLNVELATGTITDFDGRFILKEVPLGRRAVQISYIGYESITIPNVIVTSGKDVSLTIALLESFNQLDEVVLTSDTNKDRPLNKSATVSARQFGIEEVTRFSGGRSDVGRLAANFAGVSTPDDSRNDIVVRGNSPIGLLWRVEGIPIPNPNHFAAFGTTGGPVSAINPNMLKNSDFITSAFPAEYGNALGGVFDLSFRSGNVDNYEFTAQAGAFTGLEATAEGPMGNNNGSFLLAARYSLIGLIGGGAGGASTAVPNYADISFNLNFGKGKLGNFSLFGILATSNIDFLGDEIDEDDLFAAEDEDLFVESRFGVLGIKHRINLGNNTYLRTIIGGSLAQSEVNADRYFNKDTPDERVIPFFDTDDLEYRLTFSTLFNSKLSNKVTLRSGILVENFGLESLLRDREEQPDTDGDGDPDFATVRDVDETFAIVQPYLQGRFRLTESITLNAGLHNLYSSLNEQFVFEPRAGIKYNFSSSQTLSFGYGLHHQPAPLPLLFINESINGEAIQTNHNLDFVRSSHYVLGYDIKLAANWRGKVEVYYQDIENALVEPFPSSYSSLTEGADFVFDNDRVSLVNDGTGFNRGIEFTLEKFFSKGYYGLLTGSFFESKYEGSDGIERNSPFNNGYVVNFLTGREFKIGASGRNVLFVDTRLATSGGQYFTPIDLAASQEAGFEVQQEDSAFSERFDDYFRWDIKFGIRLNSSTKKRSHQFYVDLQNVTNNENAFVRRYNRLSNQIDQVNQIGFFPDFGYKFQF